MKKVNLLSILFFMVVLISCEEEWKYKNYEECSETFKIEYILPDNWKYPDCDKTSITIINYDSDCFINIYKVDTKSPIDTTLQDEINRYNVMPNIEIIEEGYDFVSGMRAYYWVFIRETKCKEYIFVDQNNKYKINFKAIKDKDYDNNLSVFDNFIETVKIK